MYPKLESFAKALPNMINQSIKSTKAKQKNICGSGNI